MTTHREWFAEITDSQTCGPITWSSMWHRAYDLFLGRTWPETRSHYITVDHDRLAAVALAVQRRLGLSVPVVAGLVVYWEPVEALSDVRAVAGVAVTRTDTTGGKWRFEVRATTPEAVVAVLAAFWEPAEVLHLVFGPESDGPTWQLGELDTRRESVVVQRSGSALLSKLADSDRAVLVVPRTIDAAAMLSGECSG